MSKEFKDSILRILYSFMEYERSMLNLKCCLPKQSDSLFRVFKDIPRKYRIYAMKKAQDLAIRGHKINYIVKKINYYKNFGIKIN